MRRTEYFGLYLFKKPTEEQKVLKELLQFLRTDSPGKGHSFSYIEAETSLHPQLSLWENLQIETGFSNWSDFLKAISPEHHSLVNLLKEPSIKSHQAQIWEKFLVSMVKGLIGPSQHLLIDMNEQLLSPLMIENFKKSILVTSETKKVYLASANSDIWLDCAHTLVERKDYNFVKESLDISNFKKFRVA